MFLVFTKQFTYECRHTTTWFHLINYTHAGYNICKQPQSYHTLWWPQFRPHRRRSPTSQQFFWRVQNSQCRSTGYLLRNAALGPSSRGWGEACRIGWGIWAHGYICGAGFRTIWRWQRSRWADGMDESWWRGC